MKILSVLGAVLAAVCGAGAADSLHDGFVNPPDKVKPWCYWWWINGHVDKATTTADLEAMKRLGFGGLLMFDSRGYWDDANHVVNPKPEIGFMSEEWQELVVHAIREAARLGLKFTMNMSSSGGKLDGPWAVGADAPKRLVYKFYPDTPEGREAAKTEDAGLPYYHDIAVQTVAYTGPEAAIDGTWRNGGDGVYSMEATSGRRLDAAGGGNAPRVRVAAGTAGCRSVVVRFGYTVLPGHERDVDVLDAAAVTGHYLRFQGELQKRIPGLVGRNKTLSALYSVSWEGTMPTWTHGFEAAFRKYAHGREIAADMPLLAGFVDADRAATEAFMRAYRRVRNDMFRDNFYGTMRDLSHARGIDWYSESGGPWQRKPQIFREADQIAFLGVNDIPQGEFWPLERPSPGGLRGRYHVRAAVAAAHLYGRDRAAAEAFTHMQRHWSVDPAFLKPVGDECFIGGVNHLVWHTFTCSPPKFGAPGAEYFAGTHINRNVTWHRELKGFVEYLGRCQWMLRQGESVQDYAVYAGDRPYQNWGLYLEKPYDLSKAKLPKGYTYDIINDDAILNRLTLKDGRLTLPSGISYGAVVWDPEFNNEPLDARVTARMDAWRAAGLKVFSAAEATERIRTLSAPDYEGPFMATHRRDGATDIYFVSGSGAGTMTLRESCAARTVEVWDPLTGARAAADAVARADGRTDVRLALPKDGSVFVVFRGRTETATQDAARALARRTKQVEGPWQVSFRFHDGVAATPPVDMTMTELRDLTTFGKNGDAGSDAVRYFAGAVIYRTRVTLDAGDTAERLSIGALPSGLATVRVNGKELDTAWCAPWTVDARGAFHAGENEIEIRYVNNWHNRLIGDCFLPEDERVTKSTLRYWNQPRVTPPAQPWNTKPTIYSGYSTFDPLQPSGLLGPVEIEMKDKPQIEAMGTSLPRLEDRQNS